MKIKTAKIKECPYCGSKKITIGIQNGYGGISSSRIGLNTSDVVHDICTNCGAVLLSRVDNVEPFKKKYEKDKAKENNL